MTSGLEQVPLPSRLHKAFSWSAHQRRPAFLLLLLIGLVSFFFWLPIGTRASILLALNIERVLIVLLFLFALVTLSLVWSAGQRMDVWFFMFLNKRDYPKWLDRVMWLTTQLGNMLAALIIAFLLFIVTQRHLA